MSKDLARSGDTITPNESIALMLLYAELAALASEGREAIRGGIASLTLSKLRTIDDRIGKKLHSIKATVR